MAIDPTRNLPSFSEMYQAYKNRGGLGQALQGGLNAYTGQKKQVAEESKDNASAQQSLAEASYYKNKANSPAEKKVPVSALPQQVQSSVLPYADEQGLVPLSVAQVASGTNKQGLDASAKEKELAAREAALTEAERHNKERDALQAELNNTKQQLGAAQQELSAANTVADITSKAEPPSLLNRGVSAAREFLGQGPTEDVLNERLKQAALQKLQERGGMAQAGGAPSPALAPAPARQPAKAVVIDGSPASEKVYNALPKGATYTFQGKQYKKQ